MNFGVLGSLWLWGGGRWVGVSGGIWGMGVPTCMHIHAHAHACACMYRNCKWLLTWRHPCLACLACLTCMCMHACIHGTPPYTHTHPRISKNLITLGTNQDISILFGDLKSVKNSPPISGCMVWWVGGYFNSFWRFEICEEFPTHQWVYGLVGGWMG